MNIGPEEEEFFMSSTSSSARSSFIISEPFFREPERESERPRMSSISNSSSSRTAEADPITMLVGSAVSARGKLETASVPEMAGEAARGGASSCDNASPPYISW